jgi:hypothetical protein
MTGSRSAARAGRNKEPSDPFAGAFCPLPVQLAPGSRLQPVPPQVLARSRPLHRFVSDSRLWLPLLPFASHQERPPQSNGKC